MLNISRFTDTPRDMAAPPLSHTLSLSQFDSIWQFDQLFALGGRVTHAFSVVSRTIQVPDRDAPPKIVENRNKNKNKTHAIYTHKCVRNDVTANKFQRNSSSGRERKCERSRPQIYVETYIHTCEHSQSRRTQQTPTSLSLSLLLPTCCQHDYEMTHKTHKAIGNVLHEVAALLLRRVVCMRARVCVCVCECECD